MGAEIHTASPLIGTLNEKPLHAALKQWYGRVNDRFEVPIDGYVIDIVRNDLLIEIQTRNFSALKRKLVALTAQHSVRLVFPVTFEKWLVKLPKGAGQSAQRRKSPKRGSIEDVFEELVSFPELMFDPNFSLEVLLIREEAVRRFYGVRAWRHNGWVTVERHLLDVVGRQLFNTAEDMATLIPQDLVEPFSTSELAAALSKPRRLAQKMVYCLRHMQQIKQSAKRGRSSLYVRSGRTVRHR